MEVESNRASSLPENYLTLAQLQDRWLKEQERKQIEKLNQERELQQQQQQQQEREEMAEREGKQREEDDSKNRTQNGATTKELVAAAKTTEASDRRNQHRRKADEPRIVANVVDEVARVAEESRQQQQKKKTTTKKNSSWKKRNKFRSAKMEAGETSEVQPEAKEEVEMVVMEKTRELEGAKSKIQINVNGSDGKVKRWVEKEKVLGDEKAHSIVQNFEGLSVNGGKGGNVRPQEGRNEGNGNRRGSERVNVRSKRPHGRRDGNYVWVKKGDSTDTGVNGVQC